MTRLRLRGLVAAMAAMVAGTVVLAVLLARAAAVLHATDGTIASAAAPRIVALETMSADLRRLEVLLKERALGAPGDRIVRDQQIAAARRELVSSEQAELALPHAAGRVALQKALVGSIDAVQAIVDRLLALPPGSSADDLGVLHDLERALARAQSDIGRAADVEASYARAAAREASRTSRTLLPAAVLLEAVSVCAAAVAIVLTGRSVHRAEAIAERGRQALERKAEELEAFAGRVAHDLLSPLMTVGLGLELAQRQGDVSCDAPTRAALERASATLQRIRAFVSDLLDFARAGARPPPGVRAQVADVVRQVADQFEPVAREAHVELRVEPVAPRQVRCSPGVLTSLLANLVQNAIKYVADSPERRVVVREHDAEGQVCVEVEDTGPGIAATEQQLLFEPFVRGAAAKAPGLGLGLATVRRLAEAHGGRVGVRSEPGKGSVFWFSLPTAA